MKYNVKILNVGGGIKCRLVIMCSNLIDHQFKIAISSWKPQTINLSSIHTHKNKGMKQKGREQKQEARPKYTLPEKTHFRSHSTHRLKVKRQEKSFHVNETKKKSGAAILTSEKIDFKTKTQPQKRMKSCYTQQHGWTWRVLC